MRHTIIMHNAAQGHTALRSLWDWCKPLLIAGHRLVVVAQQEKRSDPQNRKFHAICGDIAKSRFVWMGKPRAAGQWKALLVSGHATVTGGEVELVAGLEGELVNIRESTATMDKARGASLIEYSLSWCAMNGITVREQQEEVAA